MTPAPSNPELDRVLEELLPALARAEGALLRPGDAPHKPLLLILGAPRSGTTLLLQWLAATNVFAVPSNLIARFASAPTTAALVQRVLCDPTLALAGQFADAPRVPASFASDYGRTRGVLDANEFFHFWRRHLQAQGIEPLGSQHLTSVDTGRLRAELAGLERVFQRPVAMKALMLQYDLDWAARELPTALFLHVVRDPVANAASLLQARRRELGDVTRWWSARPPGAAQLEESSPDRQVAEQVVRTVGTIDDALAALPAERSLRIDYEELCADPAVVWARLVERCAALGERLPTDAGGPACFEVRRTRTASHAELERIEAAVADAWAARRTTQGGCC